MPGVKPTAKELKEREGMRASTRALHKRKVFENKFRPDELGLGKRERKVYDENPHCRQCWANGSAPVRVGRPFAARDMILGTESTPYRRRNEDHKTVDHWGQRKLLMSEIDFLLEHGSGDCTVVYAGAAPGTHTNYLSDLFPRVKFVLVDPAHFDARPTNRIRIIGDYFGDDLARTLAREVRDEGRKLLYVCDIRSIETGKGSDEAHVSRRVTADMQMQKDWYEVMRPDVSMLKFRLPYGAGHTLYPEGEIRLQMWCGMTSTETRLIIRGADAEIKDWDNLDYESRMFHFQTVTRTSIYQGTGAVIEIGEGLDRCWDCSAEISLLRRLLRHLGKKPSDGEVVDLSRAISRKISRGRTLTLTDHSLPRARNG